MVGGFGKIAEVLVPAIAEWGNGSGNKADDEANIAIGRALTDYVAPLWFENALGRNPEWINGVYGAGNDDRAFFEGWIGSLAQNAERASAPWQQLGAKGPQGVVDSLNSYYLSLDASARPGVGEGAGDFAPYLAAERLFGKDLALPENRLPSWLTNPWQWDWKGFGNVPLSGWVAGGGVPDDARDLSVAAQVGLWKDAPEWQQWWNDFSSQRPTVSAPTEFDPTGLSSFAGGFTPPALIQNVRYEGVNSDYGWDWTRQLTDDVLAGLRPLSDLRDPFALTGQGGTYFGSPYRARWGP
jgi:hypothetical protein